MADFPDRDREGETPVDPAGDSGADRPAPDALPLGDDADTRLPWLEADDADEDEGAGVGGLVRLLLFGVVALGLIVGGIWMLTRKGGEDAVVADGSVIEAPDAPYKEKPKDPGGKTFEGTGDTSFAVSVGQNRPSTLAEPTAAPKPGFASVPDSKAPSPGPRAPIAATTIDGGAAGGVGVQVAAFSSRSTAEAGWSKLVQQHPALSGLSHRVLEGRADIGTVYRLQAVASDAAAARALCAKLRGSGLACQVKD